jgi:hypothetical protein
MAISVFNLVRVDSPLLCGEEEKLQFESSGWGTDLFPYPVRLRRGSLMLSRLNGSINFLRN